MGLQTRTITYLRDRAIHAADDQEEASYMLFQAKREVDRMSDEEFAQFKTDLIKVLGVPQ